MTDPAGWIDRYVDGLVAAGHIRSERVERAFRAVPRHLCIAGFYDAGDRYVEVPQGDGARVPDDVLSAIYSDSELVTQLDERGRPAGSSTRPAQMAQMLEALDLSGSERVLEIGAGPGYSAALLAAITGVEVVTIDNAPDVVDAARASLRRLGEERVTVIAGDGYHGHTEVESYAQAGPYDRVIAMVGAPGIAEPWLDQLTLDGAFVVAPVLAAGRHPVLKVERGRPFTAAGRGVCWTDFRAGGAALAHRNEQTLTPGADWGPLTLTAPRTVRRFTPPLDNATYDQLVGFVMMSDRRATQAHVEGLDPELGTCVIRNGTGTAAIQRSGVIVDGPDRLASHALRLIDNWFARGRPAFADWRCTLVLDRLPSGRFWRPRRWTIGPTRTVVPHA